MLSNGNSAQVLSLEEQYVIIKSKRNGKKNIANKKKNKQYNAYQQQMVHYGKQLLNPFMTDKYSNFLYLHNDLPTSAVDALREYAVENKLDYNQVKLRPFHYPYFVNPHKPGFKLAPDFSLALHSIKKKGKQGLWHGKDASRADSHMQIYVNGKHSLEIAFFQYASESIQKCLRAPGGPDSGAASKPMILMPAFTHRALQMSVFHVDDDIVLVFVGNFLQISKEQQQKFKDIKYVAYLMGVCIHNEEQLPAIVLRKDEHYDDAIFYVGQKRELSTPKKVRIEWCNFVGEVVISLVQTLVFIVD